METLFPYQEEGASFLAGKRFALLADEMGLGKSAQAIRASDLIQAGRILVLCPAVARANWLREFEKFQTIPRPFDVVYSKKWERSARNVICSYDLAGLVKFHDPFDLLILDESHFLKSPTAKRTRAVYGKGGLVHRSARVWALSGTPAPNHAAELWPMLKTLGFTPIHYDQFVEKFCTYYEAPHGRQITGTKTSMIPELRAMLSRVMLRRKKEEVMKQLPPITFNDIVVEAGPVDLELESSFTQYVFPVDLRKELDEKLKLERSLMEASIGHAASGTKGIQALEIMAQSVSTLRRYTGIQKVKETAELVASELSAGAYEKIVIFAIHRDVIEGLRTKLSKFKPVTLYGGTPPETRQKNIDKFQKSKHCRVFIGNIQAAGTAITLTAANQVLFIEQDWVPGNNAQAAMRCHRIGQEKPVFVRFVGLAGSIDERVAQVLKRKTRELSAIFDEKPTKKVDSALHSENETCSFSKSETN